MDTEVETEVVDLLTEVDFTAAVAEFIVDHGATGEAIEVDFELAAVLVVDDEIAVASSTRL